MKKTQWIELLHMIRKTMVTFTAITIFVAMGIGLFFGIPWSAQSLTEASEKSYSKGKLHDLDIQYAFGMDDDTVAEIEKIDGVSEAEGYYQAYEFMRLNGENFQVRFISLTEKINVPFKVIGNLPQKNGEIAVENYWAEKHNVSVGDKLTFLHDKENKTAFVTQIAKADTSELLSLMSEQPETDEDGMNYLLTDTFTVTATVELPQYLSRYTDSYGVSYPDSIPVTCLAFVSEESFDMSAFAGYTNIAVRSDELRKYKRASDEYQKGVNELKEKVSIFTQAYSDEKNSEIRDKIEQIGKFAELPESAENIDSIQCSVITSLFIDSIYSIDNVRIIFDKLGISMAGMFVIIGFLVSFFTVSRIVNDNTVQIGTKKSLGIKNSEIYKFYFLYVGAACVAGAILGFLIAAFIVEFIIMTVMNDVFVYDGWEHYFRILPVLCFFAIELTLKCISAFIPCRSLLKKKTLILLKGEEPPKVKRRFYESFGIWKKLSLFSKTIVNNFFNSKKRLFSTVMVIASCTSLVVCALTINNNISGSFERQYENDYKFDGILYFDPNVSDTSEIESVLESENLDYIKGYTTSMFFESPDNINIVASLKITDSPNISKLIRFYDMDGKEFKIENGLYSSCSLAKHYDMKPGTEINWKDYRMNNHNTKIENFFENYLLGNTFFMDAETYENELGEKYKPNIFFVDMKNKSFNEMTDKLYGCEGFIYLRNDYFMSKDLFKGMSSSFKIIVVVYLIISIVTALLVLLNLFAMFISEKKRELITLMINGYTLKDAKRYIYLDSIILAVFGIAVGVVFGALMGSLSMRTLINERMFFILAPDAKACIIGMIFSAILTAATCLIALKQINKFKLTDNNVK